MKEEMTELLKRLLEMQKESPNRSEKEPSLRVLEGSAASEKEEWLWKRSEGSMEVPVEPSKKASDHEDEPKAVLTLVADLANRIKETLVEIRNLSESSRGRFKELAFDQEFHHRMTECIDNSEADLACFLDYLRIRSPVRQTNKIHVILEEALEKHKKKLMGKEIKIFRRQFEKDLPDASVHVEELRFILNGILEYVVLSAIPNRTMVILTRSLEAQEGRETIESFQQRGTKCVEIGLFLGDDEKQNKQTGGPPKTRTARSEPDRRWIIRLVDEVVKKNRGSLKLSDDSEGRLRMVSLILPIERRKIVYYERSPA